MLLAYNIEVLLITQVAGHMSLEVRKVPDEYIWPRSRGHQTLPVRRDIYGPGIRGKGIKGRNVLIQGETP